MNVTKVKIHFYGHYHGAKYYECTCTMEDGTKTRGVVLSYAYVARQNSAIQRFPSIKKAEAWLNSPDGLRYVADKIDGRDDE